jgi:hypothetical protein
VDGPALRRNLGRHFVRLAYLVLNWRAFLLGRRLFPVALDQCPKLLNLFLERVDFGLQAAHIVHRAGSERHAGYARADRRPLQSLYGFHMPL